MNLRALALLLFAASLAAPAQAIPRNAALRVSAGDGVTDAEAGQVEAALWTLFVAPLAAHGFLLEPLGPLHDALRAQGIPTDELHASMNSPANGAMLTKLRELDVELVWFTVLTRDGGKVRLAITAMGFHDLSQLPNSLETATTIPELYEKLGHDAPALVETALAKFKSAPMPLWWRPAQMIAANQAAANQASANPPAAATSSATNPRSNQPRLADGAQLAVLEFKHSAEFSPADARYLCDVVRAAVLSNVPRLSVMTRENLLVLLQAAGKDVAECEGECEVDTGRRIGADAVVSGDVLKFGARFKVSLRLHETKSGRLISAVVASGATLEELDAQLQQRAGELLASQR
jgi:TolB-like protein